MSNAESAEKKGGIKHYFDFSEVLMYFFRKKSDQPSFNFNLRMMHGINKLSILMFIFGVLFLILKLAFRD